MHDRQWYVWGPLSPHNSIFGYIWEVRRDDCVLNVIEAVKKCKQLKNTKCNNESAGITVAQTYFVLKCVYDVWK